jgi:hypothetical protein
MNGYERSYKTAGPVYGFRAEEHRGAAAAPQSNECDSALITAPICEKAQHWRTSPAEASLEPERPLNAVHSGDG